MGRVRLSGVWFGLCQRMQEGGPALRILQEPGSIVEQPGVFEGESLSERPIATHNIANVLPHETLRRADAGDQIEMTAVTVESESCRVHPPTESCRNNSRESDAMILRVLAVSVVLSALVSPALAAEPADRIDFNRQIRSILSNRCFACHGPDEEQLEAELRLDQFDSATENRGDYAAITPGAPEKSELIRRITSTDPDVMMPPPQHGDRLTPAQVALLTEWIRQGAEYARHWSYVKPVRPAVPSVKDSAWPRNDIDRFLLKRLEQEGLAPSPEADRYALIRRVTLDLTGLPPTLDEVDVFVNDTSASAYERLVDRLLKQEAYGEHWAGKWLDLARYADSTGYADDPPRTIWAYRDYVIRSLNENKPFDQFTIEQIAGDLLPDATEQQLIATAFHRNTLTNNEGGTNDEEFRNVAVVDRVNTTMAVWMGTTIACAQCHNHKFDPLSQAEFFKFFAFFNSSADADRRDESPLIEIYSEEQKANRAAWEHELKELERLLSTPTPELLAAQAAWEAKFQQQPDWIPLTASALDSKQKTVLTSGEDAVIIVERGGETDVYSLEFPLESLTRNPDQSGRISGLQIATEPNPGHGGGNFVVSRVLASIIPPKGTRLSGQFVRVTMPGKQKFLSLAEVQVFSGTENVALNGTATQVSSDFNGPPELAIDGNTNGHYFDAKSTTHTAAGDDPWWEVDLKTTQPIDRVLVWNRTDGDTGSRLANFNVQVLDPQRNVVWEQSIAESPKPSVERSLSTERFIELAAAYADYSQPGFEAGSILNNKDVASRGWSVGGQTDRAHQLTLVPMTPIDVEAGSKLTVTIEQLSKHAHHTLARFRLMATGDGRIGDYARLPTDVAAVLTTATDQRDESEKSRLTTYFIRDVALPLKAERDRLGVVKKQLADLKPATTVPVMKELPADQQRITKIQIRGNFMDTSGSEEVTPGTPDVFPPLPEDTPHDRLALAKWLVDEGNPLTSRVIANRYWEAIFGIGIVSTSEEFGSQGDLPTHPELLDWLAVELEDSGWDLKHLVKLLVTSAAYQQSSRVTQELLERDPDNRLLARGPRFRITAETVRDQTLFISGLLSRKMYGPPVRPPQPEMGVSAAFGSGIDWATSDGEDRYRRGLYTTWRRSNPYPSMMAFDAVNREVCTLKRDRTNTPLQALVTLNDPVYVEAAQMLARRIASQDGSTTDRMTYGFRTCLARPPEADELERLIALFNAAQAEFAADENVALKLATVPAGPVPDGMNPANLAAWTVVSNVLLNLDEMFMKR